MLRRFGGDRRTQGREPRFNAPLGRVSFDVIPGDLLKASERAEVVVVFLPPRDQLEHDEILRCRDAHAATRNREGAVDD